MSNKRTLALLLGAGLVIAACSTGSENSTTPAASQDPVTTNTPATTTTPATTAAPTTVAETTTTIDPVEVQTIEQVNEYIAEAAAFDQVGADAQFPQGLTFAAGGAPTYSASTPRVSCRASSRAHSTEPFVARTRISHALTWN